MGQIGISCTGLSGLVGGAYTAMLGTYPGSVSLRFNPRRTLPAGELTVTWTDGQRPPATLRKCVLDFPSIQYTTGGFIEALRLLDRRWKYAYGVLNGAYNLRKANGDIQESTKKSARELAALIFDEWQETGYDVGALPGDDYPLVFWDDASPRAELEWLMRLYGCDLAPDWTQDKMRIVRLGQGQSLPTDYVLTLSYGVDFAQAPRELQLRGEPDLIELKVKLKPVCEDTEGSVKDLDDATLDVTPDGGWDTVTNLYDPLPEDEADPIKVQLAKKWVYRSFRVEALADGTLTVPGYSPALENINQLILTDRRASGYEAPNGRHEHSEAYLEGVVALVSDTDVPSDPALNTDEGTRLDVEFSIDAERQLVWVRRPLAKYNVTDGVFEEPELFLVAGFYVEDPNGKLERFELTRTISNNQTRPLVVKRADLQRQVIVSYEDDAPTTVKQITSNSESLQQTANLILDQVQQSFAPVEAGTVTYAGIRQLRLDGICRQVTWDVQRHRALTYASANAETEFGVIRSKERMRLARVDEDARDQQRQRKERQRMRKKGAI